MDGWLCSLSFFGFGLKSLAKLLFAILMSLKSSRNGFEPTRRVPALAQGTTLCLPPVPVERHFRWGW
jgi:hypothetical protein